MATAPSSSSSVRVWRTAFLTLRDETLTSPPRTSVSDLLQNLIFSALPSLIAAAPDLPPHEVTSDLLFLLELVANTCKGAEDSIPIITKTCNLIQSISRRSTLEINASSWTLILDSFRKIVDCLLGKAGSKGIVAGNAARIKPLMDSLETIRYLIDRYERKCFLAENIELVKFLLHLVKCFHAELGRSTEPSANQRYGAESGKRIHRYCSLWEVQTVTFNVLGEVLSRVGSSLRVDIWKSTIEVLRKVMDALACKTMLVEDILMSRFYVSLLHCLHLVLVDTKSSLSDHVPGFVAALRMFFIYGLTSRPQSTFLAGLKEKEVVSSSTRSSLGETSKGDRGRYRPPHLRKNESSNLKPAEAWDSQSGSAHVSSTLDFASSDSDYSDSDGSLKDAASVQNSKVRVAAIICIQDLCQADPKSFTSQWTLLLPTNDVLQPRKFEATLMTCLLFDPYLKARVASASTLAVMLDGPSSVFLQVAEFKESTKRGSFTSLSSSLGQILMQLHSGVLYLIQHETHSKLLPSLFKILILLIPSTPYSRMPEELLPTVISSLQARINEGFPDKIDQAGLLAATISCLTTALSISPSSPQVKEMLSKEISAGFVDAEKKTGVLTTLFQYSERTSNPTICFESLQAIRAVCHNYPNIMSACWERISTTVHEILKTGSANVSATPWRGHAGNTVGVSGEKVLMGAVKALDECLRALSGFKGTEDLFDDKFLDAPFTSDCRRAKKISSAPSHETEFAEDTIDGPRSYQSGSEPWSEAIEKHIPLVLRHTSAMVRTASLTCFAGITSSTFNSLAKEKQDFILSSVVDAAVNDDVPSVRSAACRAIGVISCFQQIYESAEILDKFVHAVEINTHDPVASLRITASWALANICDSLRHCVGNFSSEQLTDSNSQSVTLLTECALRLTKDGDKVKSNAVRALGNLSRLVNYAGLRAVQGKSVHEMSLSSATNNAKLLPSSSNMQGSRTSALDQYCPISLRDSRWLERMVQAFLSCVTTGNVKVQWNVCHALSNLFLNETLRLQDMDWAPSVFSILILLLRDSSNFKIRIQAAAALAVPSSVHDYGTSFTDVVQGLDHILENFGSDQIPAPSSFKYRLALEKQLTSTVLHVLSLASSSDQEPLKDFLVKKAPFLEEWLRMLCSSLGEPDNKDGLVRNQKKVMISKAIQSLTQVYKGRNNHTIAHKFEKLEESIK